MGPKVYVVLVNYNGHRDTIECLESVLKLSYDNFQVVVVDNSETDSSFAEMIRWSNGKETGIITQFDNLVFPLIQKPIQIATVGSKQIDYFPLQDLIHAKIIFIRSDVNDGFAAANNLALRLINRINDHEYVWLLNNDTVIEKNSLTELVKNAEKSDPKVGMWGTKLMHYYEPSTIQGVGGYYNKWMGVVKEIGKNEIDVGQWDNKPFRFDYVIGASIFLKKSLIADVGLLNEDYFLYFEELDWAIRSEKKRWSLGFCPHCKVYHKGGASINKDQKSKNSLLADYYSLRNRILITKKYFPYAFITLYLAISKMFVNRIRYKQASRIPKLFGVLFNPGKHFREIKS